MKLPWLRAPFFIASLSVMLEQIRGFELTNLHISPNRPQNLALNRQQKVCFALKQNNPALAILANRNVRVLSTLPSTGK